MQVQVLTVINNYGEEKHVVRYSNGVTFFGKVRWAFVTFTQTNDPFFFDDFNVAVKKGEDILLNANPKNQKICAIANVHDIDKQKLLT